MCQSDVYLEGADGEELLMKDVGWMEAAGEGLLLKDVAGEERALPGRLHYADLVGHRIVLRRDGGEEHLGRMVLRAEEFHGHLGPYLVFGLRMGLLARRRLGFEGHFDLRVTARTGSETPVSCMVDGLQISTGATLGKGNIEVRPPRDGRPSARFETGEKELEIALAGPALQLVREMGDDEATRRAARRAVEMEEERLFTVR